MSLQPKIMINSQDDLARRKAHKDFLSKRIEASVEEFGFWNAAKSFVKKVTGNDKKKEDKKSSDFNEKEHPRAMDGKFVEAPRGEGSHGRGGLIDLEPLNNARDVEVKKEELYKAEVKQWENDKANWDAGEITIANKKIKKIQDGELKRANADLAKAKAYLKRENLSDDDFEKGSQDFQKAKEKIRNAVSKIDKIKPKPYKVKKPVKSKSEKTKKSSEDS